MIVIVMGVSGAGKTTIARMLARRCGGVFIEGDEFHPPGNVARMAGGTPLEDEDRWTWLDAIATAACQAENGADGLVVMTCSALKKAYRDRLRAGMPDRPQFLMLHGEVDLLEQRIRHRKDHFMPPSMLESQLAALERPGREEGAIFLDVAMPPSSLVERAAAALGRTMNG